MPARKSDVSAARFVLADEDVAPSVETPATETPAPAAPSSEAPPSVSGPTSPHGEKKDKGKDKEEVITIEDLTLPKSIITRLAKGVLPPNTQIQANAILALSKSAVVFISHLATTANEFTTSANKKTIMPADVFKALEETEYGFMIERVEAEFAKFNQTQTSKRSTYRRKVAAAKRASTGGGDVSMSMLSTASTQDPEGMGHDDGDDEASRAAKKARIDGGGGAEDSRMDMDEQDPSDADTIPDEVDEEEEDGSEEEVEEDEDEEEEGPGEEGEEGEERGREVDEALDDEDNRQHIQDEGNGH
ncbi:histone-fold-containing protein [Schizothecium vesticola]|uniref:DNA polymerase epsilon subunit D n=1 Tax=Schizothecium vesticola TaxID=314040 RepID=A0AA40F9Y4_9PEZI|nr:histone-fold-containing protein [Schizothecium vesticola]